MSESFTEEVLTGEIGPGLYVLIVAHPYRFLPLCPLPCQAMAIYHTLRGVRSLEPPYVPSPWALLSPRSKRPRRRRA